MIKLIYLLRRFSIFPSSQFLLVVVILKRIKLLENIPLQFYFLYFGFLKIFTAAPLTFNKLWRPEEAANGSH